MEKIESWWNGLETWMRSVILIALPVLAFLYIMWVSN